MKAALLAGYHDDWVVDDVPDPAITQPDDVIVRVWAAGFCRTDIHIWDGQFDEAMKAAGLGLPHVCGHENAGWVAEVRPQRDLLPRRLWRQARGLDE